MVQRKPRERGATLLMVTFVSTFLLIPIIGTCIDGAMLYWVKARISSAIDATALATGRSLNVGQTDAQQLANAAAIGQAYFTANFPAGLMHTTLVGGAPTITIDESVAHVRKVTVTVSVKVPLFFMPIMGFNNLTVSGTGQATRRDANVMLVLDRSNSMNNSAGSCGVLVASAQNFVNNFVDGRDQLGLVTFQTSSNVDYTPRLTFKSSNPSLNTTLGTLICGGDTSTAQGLYMAWNQIQTTINQPGALNVIVLFTDGQPNTVAGSFQIKTHSDTRYSVSNTSQSTSVGASSCNGSGTLPGAIADGTVETATSVNDLAPTGDTYAVISTASSPITSSTSITAASASGCSYNSNVRNGRQDVAYIPTQDSNGNSTIGYLALDYFPTGDYYHDQIRPDMPRTVRWAAFNATDSLSQRIRNDSTYTPIIYTIGLAGNETMAINQDFMERLANDTSASNFDPTKPQGDFIYAPTTAQLSQAFQSVASQILRLSK